MALWHLFKFLLNVGVVLFLIMGSANSLGLQNNLYKKTCPEVEEIVEKTTADFVSRAPLLAAPLLRLHFHDCFVRGCDGSVLLNSTATNQAEKDAIPNRTLRGFQLIDAFKAAVEKECPGVVSCADILAFVARDAVSLSKGPRYKVLTGRKRRPGFIGNEALANIATQTFNITQLTAAFQQKGLSVKDLVVLSGAHTIEVGHCTSFASWLYNFTGKGDADPSLDPNYAEKLRVKCPQGDLTHYVETDPGSSKIFDVSYFKLVSKRGGLFISEPALLNNNDIKTYIGLQINNQVSTFFQDFGERMSNPILDYKDQLLPSYSKQALLPVVPNTLYHPVVDEV